MTAEEFNDYCASLTGATYVNQWGGSHVWKVGGKVFSVGGWSEDSFGITVKVSPSAFPILATQPGLRPAPYLASRGMAWVQVYQEGAQPEEFVKELIQESYQLILEKLPKKTRAELAL